MKKITVLFMLFLVFTFQGYSQFNESFEDGIPATWTIINEGDANTWEISGIDYPIEAHTGELVAKISYSVDAHDDYLITQQFTVTAGVSDRLTVWVKDVMNFIYPEPFDILLSNTGNSAAAFTTTVAAQVSPSDYNWHKYTYNLSAYAGQTIYIAFHSTTENMYEVQLDDVIVDAWPTVPPGCITNPISTINPACGNFASTISWDLSTDADGYYLTVGTTSGGTDIVNNQDVGLNTTYVLDDQIENTTYYWKAVPYNVVGLANGCPINNYTTAVNACYCIPNPQSTDGSGITNVTIGTINNTTVNEDGNYGDYSALSTTVYQGLYTPFWITYETAGYTYDTKIWIDWNNDNDFDDAEEEVYNGVSGTNDPTTLSGSFVIPVTAALGNHRMRIGGQDSGPVTPCYNGYYGTFEDYTVNVAVATCSQPVATTAVTFDCPNNQFFIQVNVTNLGSGTPSITDGTATWPVTAVGNMQVGPFPFGTPVTLTLQHGSNAICNIPLGTTFYSECPPVNDECINAIALTPGTFYSNIVDGSNSGATDSQPPSTSCYGYWGGDVWYSVVVPASGSITIETGNLATGDESTFDSVISIYSGTCGALTYIDCNDQGVGVGDFSLLTLIDQIPGSTLYINVFEYFNDNVTSFGIAAYDASLNSTSFDASGLSVYPNPVKDVLNLSYTSDISTVTIVNLLGQEMLKKNIHAAQSQIDLSDLANGTYLVKIEVGDLIKTMKIIKSN